MLIKDTKNDIYKEISVSINFTFDAVKPYLSNEGTDFIKNVLGTSLYNQLDAAYDDAGTLDLLAEKWRVLLPLCQRPLVYYAYLQYLPFGDVNVSDGGITVRTGESFAPASAQRVQNLKNALEEIAYSSLEKLLKFLYANAAVYNWDPSKHIITLVSFSNQLNEHTNTSISVKTFNKMKSSIRIVEENTVRNLIFPELYDKIKEQVQDNLFDDVEPYDWEDSGSGSASGSGSGEDENIANHKILLDMLRPGIANLALAQAVHTHRIDISNTGISEIFASDRNRDVINASSPARNEVLASVVNQLVEIGNMYLKRAKDYLIEHADDFPLYENSEEYNVDETVEDSVFDNDEDLKYFSFT
jgi:hypothetical protein